MAAPLQIFANHHRQFVKGGPLWQHYRLQCHVYMAEFWPSMVPPYSAIDNTAKCSAKKKNTAKFFGLAFTKLILNEIDFVVM